MEKILYRIQLAVQLWKVLRTHMHKSYISWTLISSWKIIKPLLIYMLLLSACSMHRHLNVCSHCSPKFEDSLFQPLCSWIESLCITTNINEGETYKFELAPMIMAYIWWLSWQQPSKETYPDNKDYNKITKKHIRFCYLMSNRFIDSLMLLRKRLASNTSWYTAISIPSQKQKNYNMADIKIKWHDERS